MDSDDEVRDRATYYCRILEREQRDLNIRFILEPLQVIHIAHLLDQLVR